MSDAEPTSPEDQPAAPISSEAPRVEAGVAAEALPEPPEPLGISPAEPEPAFVTPSPLLDEPVKSPIMQRSPEREES